MNPIREELDKLVREEWDKGGNTVEVFAAAIRRAFAAGREAGIGEAREVIETELTELMGEGQFTQGVLRALDNLTKPDKE